MNSLTTFRNQFGLTSSVFSVLLQCHRTQVSMAESGRRSLPQASKTILHHLEQAYEQYAPPPDTTEMPAAVTAFLQKQVKSITAQLAELALEKESVSEKLAAAIRLQQFLAGLRAFPLPQEAEDAQFQIQILERKMPEKMKKLQLELTQIELKMGGLQGELDAANSML